MTRIAALSELEVAERLALEAEAIFWANAATQSFATDAARAAYRELWFSRYLQHFPELLLVALGDDGHAAGYLAGSRVSDAPPLTGPDYYRHFPRGLIEAYPAHIHVNIRADRQGRLLGERLIGAFRRTCMSDALGGFHAVTAADSRAAHFFSKCGLAPLEEAEWNGRRIAFLGERIAPL